MTNLRHITEKENTVYKTIKIALFVYLIVPLSCTGTVGIFIKDSYKKFKTFSSRRLSAKLKSSPTTHISEPPKHKKESLATRTTPIFEIPSEEDCEKNLEQTLSHIQHNNSLSSDDYTIASSALADILLVDRKRINKLLPISSSSDTQYPITTTIHYAIYAWCVKRHDVDDNLLVNIVNTDWPKNRSSENEKKVYTLVHEVASLAAQQYLQDLLSNKDTEQRLKAIIS